MMKDLFENWRKVLKEEEKRLTLTLPQLRITEKWGEPGHGDREIIEMFTSKIKGSTLGEKISSLQNLVKDCDEKCVAAKDVPEILGSLVFLDALAAIIYDFNDKTGGFLFESLLAALLGGKARQVPTPGGPNQPIEDLLDADDQPLSLKLLFAGPKYIKGSEKNLDRAVRQYQMPITYIVGLKNRVHETGEVLSIDFYSFTVGDKHQGIPGDFDSMKLGGKPGISVSYIRKEEYHLGTLDLGSRTRLREIANKYVERLGNTLTGIYKDLDALSTHASEYFLNAPDAKDSALEAQKDAFSLGEKTKELE